MIYFPPKKWAFIGPPKTGTTTVAYILRRKPFCGLGNMQHVNTSQIDLHTYLKFSTVRNPFSRAVSMWCHYNGDHRTEQIEFSEFIERLISCNDYSVPQFKFFHAPMHIWLEKFNPDRVIRLEHLQEDFNALPFVEQPVCIPHHNRTKHEAWQGYYDEHRIDVVRNWAKLDFELYDYPTTL